MERKLLVDMVEAYLNAKGEFERGEQITDSWAAEPDNERIELYRSSKRRSITVLAITMTSDTKVLEVYSEFVENFKASFRELFECLGFTIIERKPV